MKKNKIFNEPLLLSQVELAMLLGISRTQWIMYTRGQRGLPARIKPKLEELLQNANKSFLAKREKSVQIEAQEMEVQKELETLVKENTLKQLQVERSLTRMKSQFEAAGNTLHFVHHYSNDVSNKLFLKVIEIKAKKVLAKNTLSHQEVLKIKLEVLHYEKNLLEQRLKKLQ